MEKITNKIALTVAIETLVANNGNSEIVAKLEKMLEQVEKKSNAGKDTKKQTKTQKENAELKVLMVEVVDKPMQAKDVAEELNISVQKASALLNQMVKDGLIEKVTEKKVTKFQPFEIVEEIVNDEEEEEMEEVGNEELDQLIQELEEEE